MKVRKSVERREKLAVRPRKLETQINTQDLINENENWRVVQWFKSLSETPMTGFHTWRCRCEGVGRDSGCEYEESHLMHGPEHSI